MSVLLKNITLSKCLLKKIEKVKFLLELQSIIRFKRFIEDRVLRGALSCTIKLHTSDIGRPRAERRRQLSIGCNILNKIEVKLRPGLGDVK